MKGRTNRGIKIRIEGSMRYFFVILIISMLSCKSQKNTNMENTGDEQLVLLEQDGYSAIDTFDTMVVRDQKTLNAFYAKINKTRKPGLPVPEVNFSNEMVLIVCMGEQIGEDLPDLMKKEENEHEIIFQINPADPQNNTDTSLISSPFCVYKMPISEKDVVFLKN